MNPPNSKLGDAAGRAVRRRSRGEADPEPTLAARLAQIGVLGWAVVAPILLCLVIGRWLDRTFGSGIFFTGPAIVIGAGIGLWAAWRWMHRA